MTDHELDRALETLASMDRSGPMSHETRNRDYIRALDKTRNWAERKGVTPQQWAKAASHAL